MRLKPVLLLSALLFINASAAEAQTVRVNVDDPPTFIGSGSAGSMFIGFRVSSGNSYCCHATSTSQSNLKLSTVFDFPMLGSHASTARGLESPRIDGTSAEQRRCLFADEDEWYGVTVQTESGSSSLSNVSAQCQETTLFGGYNTFTSAYNFLELTSRLRDEASPLQVRLTVVNSVTKETIINGESIMLAPGERRDFDIHSRVGALSYGTIVLTHDGPPGALSAVLTQYRIIGNDPTQFEPTLRDELNRRVG